MNVQERIIEDGCQLQNGVCVVEWDVALGILSTRPRDGRDCHGGGGGSRC